MMPDNYEKGKTGKLKCVQNKNYNKWGKISISNKKYILAGTKI